MISRRSFIRVGACGAASAVTGAQSLVRATGGWLDPRVAGAAMVANKRVREFSLVAAPGRWPVDGTEADPAWLFNGQSPGPELRVTEGEIVRVALRNELPQPTTIHWHGVPVPFGMDGVPELTQAPVPPGGTFTYEFPATVPGTYWYHSHFNYQFERGLFGTLIVEPKRESLSYDKEYTLVFDDWLRNVDHPIASAMPYNMTVGGVVMGAIAMNMADLAGRASGESGGDRGTTDTGHASAHGSPRYEPVFDAYTVNGHSGAAIRPLTVKRGDRVRLRLINASTATVMPIYLAGHRLTITHSDGQPVTPLTVDAVPIGMGERMDVVFVANNPGAWRLGSTDPRHGSLGLGVEVRYDGMRPDLTVVESPVPRVSNLPYRDMRGAIDADAKPADRTYSFDLWRRDGARWSIDEKSYPDFTPLTVAQGERIRIRIRNMSMFAHPVHLHGHFFDVVRPYGSLENVSKPLRKDTLTFYHMDEHVVEFTADNPGLRWFLHCHNQYHHVAGMATEVRYV
jgi:FtsP/CotA-like multicopper oxidase with cupredoxin domain